MRPPTQMPAVADPQWLRADRLLAAVLILLQLGVLAYLSGARAFPVSLCVLTLWGLRTRFRLRVEKVPLNLFYATMTIAFLLHYMFAPYPLPLDSQFIRSSLAHSLARLLICVQLLQLYLDQPGGRLPIWMATCGSVALTFATNLNAPAFVHQNLQGAIAAFVGVFALYGGCTRRVVDGARESGWLRGMLVATALLMVVALGSGASWALQKHERNIDSFLTDYLGYGDHLARAGFAPNGRLQSASLWKTDGGERVMLRIFADQEPGYLRGKAFDTYQGSSRETSYTPWVSTTPRHPLGEAIENRMRLDLRPGDRLYQIAPAVSGRLSVLDVWPEEGMEARVFLPLGASLLAVNGSEVRMDAHRVVTIDDRLESLPYSIFAPAAPPSAGPPAAAEPLTEALRLRLTSLDSPVDAQVRKLAEELFAEARTTQDKLRAVKRYFHENYRYNLGLGVPHQQDPITYFLTEQPAAHCEYFATGTAVLLRLADVPCRYVVGYVAAERNRMGGFWVARNRDAHAWVEAYDDQAEEWVVVESTPAVGVPQPREQTLAGQFFGALRHRLSIWRMGLREYGMIGLLFSIGRLIWSVPGLVVLLGFLLVLMVRSRGRWFARTPRERRPPHLKDMHRVLARIDRLAREHGFERGPGETLTQFANRLRRSQVDAVWTDAAAHCYALYVDLRYREQTGPAAVQCLREAIAGVPAISVQRSANRHQRSASETSLTAERL